MLGLAKQLRGQGILGINRRNAEYTLRYNERRLYPLADDKLRTKVLAEKGHIATPELYGVIRAVHEVRRLTELLGPYFDFVVKPARGSGGDGILVIAERFKNRIYRNINGDLMDEAELKHHVLNILSGIYSLGGNPDKVLIEYRVQLDPVFEAVSYQGVPDIRIIVFLGVPVMGMIRLPTRMSGGKANLHQGAVGVGIDLATGTTLTGVCGNGIITEHPDTGNSLSGLEIPGWHILLELAARCYQLTGLGYQGVDIVLDKDKGPLILELNARPGLNIQIANCNGLHLRLKQVEKHREHLGSVEECVTFAKEQFGKTRG
jgi:alpha-L-glutamate ligase-like protein